MVPEIVPLKPPPIAAAKWVPSAEEATELQAMLGALVADHASPAFVERLIWPPTGKPFVPWAATISAPSAEQAREVGQETRCVVIVQLLPELVEVKIGPNGPPGVRRFTIVAANFVPSAEVATEYHPLVGALAGAQTAPE